MSKENKNASKVGVFATLWRWIKRMFMGASKELTDDERFAVEKIESPSVMAVKAFFRRKLAVVALVVLIMMFALVFIGPLFVPMDLNYTDPLQANIAPNYTMLSVPAELAGDVKEISSFSDFSVGLSNAGDVYLWGNTKNNLTNVDFTVIPDEVADGGVYAVAAGSDHVIAITNEGKIIGWGNNTVGQYGYLRKPDDPYVQMPTELIEGTVELDKVDQLVSGYQVTGLVLDGRLYIDVQLRALTEKDFK